MDPIPPSLRGATAQPAEALSDAAAAHRAFRYAGRLYGLIGRLAVAVGFQGCNGVKQHRRAVGHVGGVGESPDDQGVKR